MPWVTPSLEQLRSLNRDNITAQLRSGPMIPNSVLRVMADGNAGLAYLVLLYVNWLSLQLMPDTSETAWLDRHANIWIGGRKAATFALGVANVSGLEETVLPNGSQFSAQGSSGSIPLQTIEAITVGAGVTPVNFVALVAGDTSITIGDSLSLTAAVSGIDGISIASLTDGIAEEGDDDLRVAKAFNAQSRIVALHNLRAGIFAVVREIGALFYIPLRPGGG